MSDPRRADPDSRARTHLANERTFLAWLRTGLSLVALGLASAQFLETDLIPGVPITTVFSLFLVVSGMLLTVLGGIHYSHARLEIDAGAFLPSSRATVVGMTLAIIAGALALVLVVLLRLRG
jgi:putative membrane protein